MPRSRTSTEPIRFLLVEDDTVASINLECILEELGHTVTAVAATQRRAREALHRHMEQIDAAILDHDLVGQSSKPLADSLSRRGIPCAVASALEKPYTADRVAGLLARLNAA